VVILMNFLRGFKAFKDLDEALLMLDAVVRVGGWFVEDGIEMERKGGFGIFGKEALMAVRAIEVDCVKKKRRDFWMREHFVERSEKLNWKMLVCLERFFDIN